MKLGCVVSLLCRHGRQTEEHRIEVAGDSVDTESSHDSLPAISRELAPRFGMSPELGQGLDQSTDIALRKHEPAARGLDHPGNLSGIRPDNWNAAPESLDKHATELLGPFRGRSRGQHEHVHLRIRQRHVLMAETCQHPDAAAPETGGLELGSEPPVTHEEEIEWPVKLLRSSHEVANPLLRHESARKADGEAATRTARSPLPLRDSMGDERDPAASTPVCDQICCGRGSRSDECGVAKRPSTCSSCNPGQWTLEGLVCLNTERNAEPRGGKTPLCRRQGESLLFEQNHLRADSPNQRGQPAEVQVPLGSPRQNDRKLDEARFERRKGPGGERTGVELVAPPARDDEGQIPAESDELGVDVLIHRQDARMADDEESPSFSEARLALRSHRSASGMRGLVTPGVCPMTRAAAAAASGSRTKSARARHAALGRVRGLGYGVDSPTQQPSTRSGQSLVLRSSRPTLWRSIQLTTVVRSNQPSL